MEQLKNGQNKKTHRQDEHIDKTDRWTRLTGLQNRQIYTQKIDRLQERTNLMLKKYTK